MANRLGGFCITQQSLVELLDLSERGGGRHTEAHGREGGKPFTPPPDVEPFAVLFRLLISVYQVFSTRITSMPTVGYLSSLPEFSASAHGHANDLDHLSGMSHSTFLVLWYPSFLADLSAVATERLRFAAAVGRQAHKNFPDRASFKSCTIHRSDRIPYTNSDANLFHMLSFSAVLLHDSSTPYLSQTLQKTVVSVSFLRIRQTPVNG